VSARPQLDAVIFDAGGTLVRLDFEWMGEAITRRGHPVSAEALRRAEVEGRRAYDHSFGRRPAPGEPSPALGTRGDIDAYYAGTLAAAGVPAAMTRELVEAFQTRHRTPDGLWSRPVEGARTGLDGVAALGLRVACVSNSDGRAEHHLKHCGMREGLEFVVDSEIVGVEKPDPRIFQIALERMGLAPERALYVGDIQCVDAVGSTAAGMYFVLIDPFRNYAAAGMSSITGMDQLPDFVTRTFEVPGHGAPATAPASHRAVP